MGGARGRRIVGSRRIRVVAYLVLVLAVLLPIVLQWVSTGRRHDEVFGTLVTLPSDPAKPMDVDTDRLSLTFDVTSFDATTGAATVLLTLDAGVWREAPRRDVDMHVSLGPGTLRFRFAGMASGYPTWQPVLRRVRFAGNPRAYPQDEYVVALYAAVEEPTGIRLDGRLRTERDVANELVASAELVTGSGFSTTEREELYWQRDIISLARPAQVVWYTYAIALTPLLLLLAISSQLLRSRRATIFSVESAVAVLALLPLRDVLVPASLTKITRVDLVLAAELVTFFAVAGATALFLDDKAEAPAGD